MPAPRTDQPAGGEPKLNGSSPKGGREPQALDDLNRLIQSVQAAGSRVFAEVADLIRAQWRLTSYVFAGSVRILALRFGALAIVGLLALATWIFVNVTVWQAIGSLTGLSFAPPLALVLLNSIAAGSIYHWQTTLRLK